MAEAYEFLLPVIAAVIAIVPLVGVWRAFLRVRSVRLLFATLAFLCFVVTGALLVLVALSGARYADAAEPVEFGSDITTVTLFALSFLWPRREPDGA
jgi:hypothetical protein